MYIHTMNERATRRIGCANAQLYDNEENTTECDKMRHIQKNLRDTQVPRHPNLTSSQSISEAAQNAGVSASPDGSVSIPMGFGGLENLSTYEIKPGQKIIFRIRHRKLFGGSIGPDLDDRGYEDIASMDYPLLPAGVDIYRRMRRP